MICTESFNVSVLYVCALTFNVVFENRIIMITIVFVDNIYSYLISKNVLSFFMSFNMNRQVVTLPVR